MPIDTSMYSTLQVPNAMQTLGQVAGAVQQMNQAKISTIDANEMQALQPVLRDVNSYSDDQGNIDFNRLVPQVMSVAPKNGASIIQNMAEGQRQKVAAQNAISTQSADALGRASNVIFDLSRHPDDLTPEMLDQTAAAINKNFNNPMSQQATNQMFDYAKKVLASTKPGDPMRATAFQHLANMYQPIPEQQSINTPTPVQMNNNQQSWLQNLKPGVIGSPQNGVIANSAVQQQLPPNTPVMQGNTPGYLGPQLGGIAPNGQPQKTGFVASGNPVGTNENLADNVSQMNTHFSKLQDQSQNMQTVQALRGNIMQLADKAVTGTENDRRAYVNGLLNLLHIPGTGDIKNDTDLLDKYLAQLNTTTPASTDAARMLVTAGRPGAHMNPEALKEATNQVASQIEANVAERNYLSQYKLTNNGQGDAVGYQKAREQFEKVGDPRVWQYMSLQPGSKEAQQFMKKLTPQDRQQLINKTQTLDSMGVLQ